MLSPKLNKVYITSIFSPNQGSESPKMIWDTEEPSKEGSGNTTAEVGLPAMGKSLGASLEKHFVILLGFITLTQNHDLHT